MLGGEIVEYDTEDDNCSADDIVGGDGLSKKPISQQHSEDKRCALEHIRDRKVNIFEYLLPKNGIDSHYPNRSDKR